MKPISPTLIEALDQRVLRYFLAVVRAGSIRRGAEVLNVTPSAISRQITELEAVCGHVLLDRLARGVTPTEVGRVVCEFAQRQAELAEQLLDRLQHMDGIRQSTVRLWCGDGLIRDLLNNGMPGFLTAHPRISVKLTSASTDEIVAAVAEGRADVGLAYHPPDHSDIQPVRTVPQPLLAVVLPDHHLAGRGARSLLEFAQDPAAAQPRNTAVRQLLGRVEEEGDFRLNISFETTSHEAMRLFVLRGLGIMYQVRSACREELDDASLVAVELSEPILRSTTTQLFVRARRRLPEAVDLVARALAENMAVFARPATVDDR